MESGSQAFISGGGSGSVPATRIWDVSLQECAGVWVASGLGVGRGLCSPDIPLGKQSLLCPQAGLTLAGADLSRGRIIPIKMVLTFDIHTIAWILLLALLPCLGFHQ